MPKFSLTFSGVAVQLVGYVLSSAGVAYLDGDVEKFVALGVVLLGACMTLYGRYRRGGVNWLGFKPK